MATRARVIHFPRERPSSRVVVTRDDSPPASSPPARGRYQGRSRPPVLRSFPRPSHPDAMLHLHPSPGPHSRPVGRRLVQRLLIRYSWMKRGGHDPFEDATGTGVEPFVSEEAFQRRPSRLSDSPEGPCDWARLIPHRRSFPTVGDLHDPYVLRGILCDGTDDSRDRPDALPLRELLRRRVPCLTVRGVEPPHQPRVHKPTPPEIAGGHGGRDGDGEETQGEPLPPRAVMKTWGHHEG